MFDITPELILCHLKEVWSNMADRLEELVYTDESKEMVDIINVLLIGWILLGLIVYIVGNIIANQLYKSKKKEEKAAEPSEEPVEKKEEEPVTAAKPPLPTECLNHKPPSIIINESKTTVKEPVTPQPRSIVPIAAGTDPDCVSWVNSILTWVYGQPSPLIFLTDAWIRALNEKSQEQQAIQVNFEQVDVESQPLLSDIHVDLYSEDKVAIAGKLAVEQISFTVSSSKDSETPQQNIVVKDLTGKLKVDAAFEEPLFTIYFPEYPEFKTSLKATSIPGTPTGEKVPNRDTLISVVNKSIATAVVHIDATSKDDFPQFQKTKPGIDFSKVDEHVSEKLIIKSIKASNLGGSEGCVEPYCVVELDDPGQKFETLTARNTNSPLWDQQFTFKLNNISSELLFEIYDKGIEKDNFLGLGIISLEELSKNTSQRQVIPLQSRPLEKDEVTGAITAEFTFVDGEGHSLTGVRSGRIIEKNSRVTPGGTIITTTTIKRTADGKVYTSVIVPATAKLESTSNGQVLPQKENSIPTKFSVSEKAVIEPSVHSSIINTSNSSQTDLIFNPTASCFSLSNTLINSENSMQQSCAVDKTSSLVSNSISHPPVPPAGEIPSLDPVVSVTTSASSSDLPLNGVTDTVEIKDQEEAKLVDDNEAKPTLTSTDVETVGEESLTDTALRELENHGKSGVPASKSTLIIHSVARESAHTPVKVKLDKNGKWHEVSQDSPGKSSSGSVPSSPPSKQEGSSTLASTSSSASERDEANRSRPKEKRSLMGTLRRRLSLRKTRSKSMEQKHDKDVSSQASSRSASADRSRSMPGSRETSSLRSSGNAYLNVPGGSKAENDSTRSSISEASGISGSSTKTYISDKSTLVIEANENGVIKRYLIPASLATRSKWRKKGLKLHVYNDHIFVAKHLSGIISCEVCSRRLSRRPGKQGYECRDCKLQCHKPCHVKVEGFCRNSTINTMEVEYVQDTSKPKKS